MKTKLLISAFLILGLGIIQAQETSVDLSMGSSYANQVYYKLSTETETTFSRDTWDLAFLRVSAYAFATRVNDGKGIQVFEASANTADWTTIDVANEGTWIELHNSETDWFIGAFDMGSATYGWGEYNVTTHHVEGAIIFVLKYADGTYRKLIIDDYSNGYTIIYSTWNGSSWSADETVTISNTSNPDNDFNYYSLENNAEVLAEPASTDWDFVFTKYATDYFGDGSLYYGVTGTLHHSDITIAENDESAGADVSNLEYSEEINTIGYDWKSYTGSGYEVSADQVFYVKYADDTIYRMYFTAFEGSATGNLSFNFEDVTSTMSVDETNLLSFGVFPNPSSDKKINVVYDTKVNSDSSSISIFNITGSKVFEKSISNISGFYNSQLDLSSLSAGIYILKLKSGDSYASKKIVLQ
ncbi:T9SS type A sorting domain-containing protein [Urechidicola croceus]|uniref:Secretion system C-terminal sorting domain-containing protein n=1 Tax=Urechidicola croceus TaxID=1850246 RepID=A0A1D8P6I7_9FLAO|nr:T9SS type A sorting domain-containing protein [Urechidicola croceus]AOW20183.1 hypothetical protein LPB138_05585 [Urechidicola croceus]